MDPQLLSWCLPLTFPDIWLETCKRYNLYEIGLLTMAGCLCMTGFQWKLNLWKVNPRYPKKLVLKLTVSLLLLWLWSLNDHLPVFIWLWLSLSLLLKSLKEHSLQQSTYSRFISGITIRLIYGGCCFFNFSTLFDMKHWFEFEYWLLYLLSHFIYHLLEGVWW